MSRAARLTLCLSVLNAALALAFGQAASARPRDAQARPSIAARSDSSRVDVLRRSRGRRRRDASRRHLPHSVLLMPVPALSIRLASVEVGEDPIRLAPALSSPPDHPPA